MDWRVPAVLAVLHLALAAVAGWRSWRVGTYTRLQRTLQVALAFLVPVFGAFVVLLMARDAFAPVPGPDESNFDRQYIGND